MVSGKKLAILTAAVLVPVLLIVASAALAQEPVYIEKSDSPDPVYAGEELFYEIFITPPDMGLWWVSDTLPAEVTYISDTLAHIPAPGGTYVISEGCQLVGNELGCLLYASDYEPRSFQIKTRVAPNAVAGLDTGTVVANNVAWLTDWDGSPGYPGPFAAEGTFIEDLADLLVVKMSKPDTHVEAGELFTYTIFVENLGPSYARNVSIRDEILSSGAFTVMEVLGDPNRADACYVAPDGGIPEGPGETIECDLADPLEPKDIAGRGRWVVQVVLSANETQDVNNLVNVFSRDPDGPEGPGMPTADPDLSNNMAEDFIYVTDVADLSVEKYHDGCWHDGETSMLTCFAGGNAQFDLVVQNYGPSTAENVVVQDLLPAGVTVVDVFFSEGSGSCTTGIPGDPLAPLTCNLGDLPSGGYAQVTINVRFDPDYVDAELPSDYRTLENDAWAYSDIFDPDNSDNRDYVIVEVETLSELAITKWGFPDMAGVGDGVEYEIRIRNFGPSTADMVHFVDLLPPTVDYEDYFFEQGTGTCTYHEYLPWPWWDEYRGVHCYVDEIPPNGIVMVHLLGTYNEELWWAESDEEVCNVIPDDDPFSGVSDQFGVDDIWSMPGWFADSRIRILWENSIIEGEPEFFGWCPDETYVESDLSIEKTSEPMKIYPGEQKLYHIEVTNNGPTGAPYVMVTDTLPVGLAYEIDDGDCELVSTDPDQLECHLGDMMPGETKSFDVWALVFADAPPGEITNTVVVSMPYDTNRDNNTAWATNLVLEPILADLELNKSIATPPHPPFFAGGNVRFRLQVYNHGPVAAQNVVLEDMLPAGVTVLNVNSTQGSCTWGTPGSTPLRCDLGTLDVDAMATVMVGVRISPDYMGALQNDAWVSSDIYDPNNSNDRDSVNVPVNTGADLTLDKDAPPPSWYAGEIRTYRYNINNNGPSVSRDVRLRDFLPDEVEFVSAYAFKEGSTGGIPLPCNVSAANVLICPLGDIAPTDPPGVVVLVDVYIKPDVPDGTWIYNDADLITDTPDPGGASDDVYTLVHNEADLSVRKQAEPWKVFAGEQVMYTIEVINNGPGNAYGVFVTDTLPSEVQFELVTDPACYPVDGMVECYWEGLALGETKTFYIFGRVDPGAEPGTVSNSVEVVSDSWDPVEYNDYASAATLIRGRADLKIQKFGKPEGEVRAGDELTYTVIVDNLGTGYAHEVTLDDVLESDGSFDLLEVTSDRDALCDPETGTFEQDLFLSCALSDTLEVKGPEPGSGRWMMTVVILANEPQDINNVAFVAGADYDPDLSNNEATAEHEITAVADLELTKEAWGEMLVGCEGETELWLDEVAAGATVTYTLTVSNTGPSTAENVMVLDEPLPYPELLEIDVESIEPSQGGCLTAEFIDERRLSCNLGTIGPEMSATVTFVGYVPSWVPDYTVLVNDAVAYSDMFDDNNGNDVVSNHTIVSRVADLEVLKTQEPEIALPGWDITYSVTVTNLGPSDAEGVFISDTIPVQILDPEWTCCASDGGDCDVVCEPPVCPEGPCEWPDPGLFAQADIPAGEWVIYTITGTLDWWPCGPFTNTVTLTPPESLTHPPEDIDPCDENNTDIAVNDPFCHFDPLVLKAFPGPDSPP